MKFEIKHRVTGAVLFSSEDSSINLQPPLRQLMRGDGFKLDGADLHGADMAYMSASDASFVGADFAKASLCCVAFIDCDFTGANFTGANLSCAGFENCKFNGADLSGADFEDSEFHDCDLTGAILDGATLDGIDLVGCTTTGTSLKGARWYAHPQHRVPFTKAEYRYKITVLSNHMKIGCQTHTIEEWGSFTDEEILRMDGRPALLWWRAHKQIILELAR